MFGDSTPLRIEFFTREFLTAPPKKIETRDEGTGRVYLMFKDRVVAVAQEVGQ